MRPEDLVGQYEDLRASYEGGGMSHDAFLAECEGLMALDEAGTWWAVDASGQLLRHDSVSDTWQPGRLNAGASGPWAVRGGGKAPAPETGSTTSREPAPTRLTTSANAPAFSSLFDKESLTNIAIVFGVSLVISWLGWGLLMILPVSINALIPTGGCSGYAPKTFGMYVCSAFVGLSVVFGSIVLAMVMILLRKPITAVINKLNATVPQQHRSVMPAIVAAVFFAIVWSGSHYDTGYSVGIVSHRAFPAIVGVLVHLTIFYGPTVMQRFPAVFDARDRLSKPLRWVSLFLIPTGLSLLLTFQERVSNEAFKQQFVVIVGMLAAYVLLTPRPGAAGDAPATPGGGRR
ncbi:hypothetical protein [Sinisalibacter lacisalsi]|uniref:Uncharacterized protein n=1 Tax=Sinisalibacter lacisalsi TaxID=1526570 RepID=A0ABQ1QEJ2_9RHOB|nr:hypothetical protein [Sinisalibacter lacisalsi]GGD24826.1 hypothetical protein GCM10011358_06600 [Sinisalibacter lacisalsi]